MQVFWFLAVKVFWYSHSSTAEITQFEGPVTVTIFCWVEQPLAIYINITVTRSSVSSLTSPMVRSFPQSTC